MHCRLTKGIRTGKVPDVKKKLFFYFSVKDLARSNPSGNWTISSDICVIGRR